MGGGCSSSRSVEVTDKNSRISLKKQIKDHITDGVEINHEKDVSGMSYCLPYIIILRFHFFFTKSNHIRWKTLRICN
jgi:hypothetical protein